MILSAEDYHVPVPREGDTRGYNLNEYREASGKMTLTDSDRAILQKVSLGYTNAEIAAEFGVTSSSICQLKADPVSQRYLVELDADSVEHVKALRRRVLSSSSDILQKLMTDFAETSDISERRKIGFAMLDRAGLGVVKETKAEISHRKAEDLDSDDIRSITARVISDHQRAKAGLPAPSVEDADVV